MRRVFSQAAGVTRRRRPSWTSSALASSARLPRGRTELSLSRYPCRVCEGLGGLHAFVFSIIIIIIIVVVVADVIIVVIIIIIIIIVVVVVIIIVRIAFMIAIIVIIVIVIIIIIIINIILSMCFLCIGINSQYYVYVLWDWKACF